MVRYVRNINERRDGEFENENFPLFIEVQFQVRNKMPKDFVSADVTIDVAVTVIQKCTVGTFLEV